jgi:hypothetical protein
MAACRPSTAPVSRWTNLSSHPLGTVLAQYQARVSLYFLCFPTGAVQEPFQMCLPFRQRFLQAESKPERCFRPYR